MIWFYRVRENCIHEPDSDAFHAISIPPWLSKCCKPSYTATNKRRDERNPSKLEYFGFTFPDELVGYGLRNELV